MTDDSKKNPRRDRLAQQLRANLLRRKAQARERREQDDDTADKTEKTTDKMEDL